MDMDYDNTIPAFEYDKSIYEKRVYNGWGKADKDANLEYGPNICDWPEVIELTDNIVVKLSAVINDPVTTTDELIPSGETSSYRSNPMKLAEFALSRKCPDYVGKAKKVFEGELDRRTNGLGGEYLDAVKKAGVQLKGSVSIGSGVYAVKPGDGSAREQAASCQRVLGGVCNIAKEYATKRYRSNLINWGMLPFLSQESYQDDDIIVVYDVKNTIDNGGCEFKAKIVRGSEVLDTVLTVDALTADEREIISKGCLINYYKAKK